MENMEDSPTLKPLWDSDPKSPFILVHFSERCIESESLESAPRLSLSLCAPVFPWDGATLNFDYPSARPHLANLFAHTSSPVVDFPSSPRFRAFRPAALLGVSGDVVGALHVPQCHLSAQDFVEGC